VISEAEAWALMLASVSLPRTVSNPGKTAVAVFTGQNANYLIEEAGVLCKAIGCDQIYIANTRGEDEEIYSYPRIRVLLKTNKIAGLFLQSHTPNTKTQAQWVLELAEIQGLESIQIVALDYHMARVILTAIALMHDRKKYIVICPAFVPNPIAVSELGFFQENMEKIRAYQAKGDVASRVELLRYVEWLNLEYR